MGTEMRLGEVIAEQEMVIAEVTETVEVILERLWEKDISSMPVLKDKGDLTTCVGMIDFSDIAGLLVRLRDEGYEELGVGRKNLWKELGQREVGKVLLGNKFGKASVDMTVMQGVQECSFDGIRRLLAMRGDEVVGVVSPSELVKQLVYSLDGKEDGKWGRSLKELGGVGSSPVITVKKNSSLFDALKLMERTGKSTVGIIDPQGALQGSLSATDVKYVWKERHERHLSSSCWNFLRHIKQKEVDAIFPYFGVSEETKLITVMSKLLATGVHHLYVVDANGHALKVINFAQVCKALLIE